MKHSRFQSRLSSLIAEAIQSKIPSHQICDLLRRHHHAVNAAMAQAQQEQTAREVAHKICLNPSKSSK